VGRHTSPSQVEKVALQAGKAAPAVAIAGVLVAAPQAQNIFSAAADSATTGSHQVIKDTASVSTANVSSASVSTASVTAPAAPARSSLDAVTTRAVTVAAAKTTKHTAAAKTTTYRVQSGDTLASIAQRFYHSAADWQYLYHENAKTIANPDDIFAGEQLVIPATANADYKLTDYVPKHSRRAAKTAVKHTTAAKSGGSTEVVQTTAAGDYGCSALEQVWENAGGSPAHALMAAEIAMAESGGNPNAISPTDDFGLWQINASNGALATLNVPANAKSAIILSDNGSNWDAWTTYTSGAYAGKC
jgi:LysM repeat protein